MENIYLLAGTHKGAFILQSDRDRKKWEMKGPFFRGTDIHHFVVDIRQNPTFYACVNNPWWGCSLQMSQDFGETWQEPQVPPGFAEDSQHSLKRIWQITIAEPNQPGVLYAGVDPAALFKSEDGGQSWREIESLTTHATRDRWAPGAGGMMVHSIVLHPDDANKIKVGISAAGMFCSEDGGETWEPRNKGVLADFLAEKYPEVGQCVHRLQAHREKPEVLYQQNHCGVYRSDNG
ncbi:MAG: exo-alpha-sialidase, partial [Calditrichaeota bacterium]